MKLWFGLKDGSQGAPKLITEQQAKAHNQRGYGIFKTVNEFEGRRVKQNLTKICSWFVELDDGSKQEQLVRIKKGLIPSRVIETKRGFHVYFDSINAQAESWKEIVWDRLIPFYKADPRAKDICRILRVPGYYHLKDPSNPFLVREIFSHAVRYNEQSMKFFYPLPKELKKKYEVRDNMKKINPNESSVWDRMFNQDCEKALERLSGKDEVNGDVYTFVQNPNGNKNILVNNKKTSCFIDQRGHIGSSDGGGPTIFQWVNWYKRNKKQTYDIVKKYFPELWVANG